MPKNILQDVVPRDTRRSIREIPLPGQDKDIRAEIVTQYEEDLESQAEEPIHEFRYSHKEEETVNWRDDQGGSHAKWIIWVIGIVSAGVLAVVVGNLFSGATVTITPKSQSIALNANFTAKTKAVIGELSYTPYSLVREKTMTLPADGEKSVETRATGRIIVYNNYSTGAQRLIKNTRFETPDGLIYKIPDSIVIPGRTTVNGRIIPGSIEVSVSAESAGSEYNIGLTDFTIPGFKSNAERFANFYARSKTIMTGGRIGKEKTISDKNQATAEAKLEAELMNEFLADARAHLPADSLFYEEAYGVQFDPILAVGDIGKDSVTVSLQAKFTAYFIKSKDLAVVIAKNSSNNFGDSKISMLGEDRLTFKLVSQNDANAFSSGTIRFNLKGNVMAVWQVDGSKFVTELAGRNKKELSGIASNYPEIIKATVVVRPFWRSSFPTSVSKIKVVSTQQ